jgi:CDGSH-type Zn-finger protein
VPYESEERDGDARRVWIDEDGPVLVQGPVEVVLPDGRTVRSDRFTVALCVCRRSRAYPWCDTSHRLVPRTGQGTGTGPPQRKGTPDADHGT